MYGNIVLKAQISLCDPCNFMEALHTVISTKGYLFNVVMIYLNTGYIGTNIDFVINTLKQKSN